MGTAESSLAGSRSGLDQALLCELELLERSLGPAGCTTGNRRWQVFDIPVSLPEAPSVWTTGAAESERDPAFISTLAKEFNEQVASKFSGWQYLENLSMAGIAQPKPSLSESSTASTSPGPPAFSVHYFESGPLEPPSSDGPAPIIVLLHGFGDGLPMFLRILPLLNKRCHIFALDLPGMACSGRPALPKGYDVAWRSKEAETFFVNAIEEWVLEVIPRSAVDPSEPEPFFVCGHSFGGYLSMVYAMKQPKRVKELFLLSPMLGFHERPPMFAQGGKYEHVSFLFEWAMERKITPQTLVRNVPGVSRIARSVVQDRLKATRLSEEELQLMSDYKVAVAGRMDGEPSDPLFFACFGPWLRPERRMERRWPRRGRCDATFFYGANDYMDPLSAQEICKILGRNVVVLTDDQHDVFGSPSGSTRSKCYQRADFIMVPEAGHYPHIDDPAMVAKAILQKINPRWEEPLWEEPPWMLLPSRDAPAPRNISPAGDVSRPSGAEEDDDSTTRVEKSKQWREFREMRRRRSKEFISNDVTQPEVEHAEIEKPEQQCDTDARLQDIEKEFQQEEDEAAPKKEFQQEEDEAAPKNQCELEAQEKETLVHKFAERLSTQLVNFEASKLTSWIMQRPAAPAS